MSKQQTAVESFENGIKQLYERDGKLKIGYVIRLIQDTKQMEKGQIVRAYEDNHALSHLYGNNGEIYYNETYGKENTGT